MAPEKEGSRLLWTDHGSQERILEFVKNVEIYLNEVK